MHGIILRSFLPYKKKISVLTEATGKINIIVRGERSRFPAGSVMSFHAALNARFVVLSNEKFLYVPTSGVLEHLEWLHHMLEICYYFVPLRLPCEDVFRTLLLSIRIGHWADAVVKRICLLKLLLLLGFHPADELIELSNLFDRVVSAFLDSSDCQKVRSLQILQEKVPKALVERVDKWILRCLKEHPYAAHFKTL